MVPKTRITRIFYIGDLRSGQFDGLAIISQWENIKLLILSKVRITLAYLFQDHIAMGSYYQRMRQFLSMTRENVI